MQIPNSCQRQIERRDCAQPPESYYCNSRLGKLSLPYPTKLLQNRLTSIVFVAFNDVLFFYHKTALPFTLLLTSLISTFFQKLSLINVPDLLYRVNIRRILVFSY